LSFGLTEKTGLIDNVYYAFLVTIHTFVEEMLGMADANLAHIASGFGAGLVTIGAAYGIGRIASAAMEGSARNPQSAGDVRTSMIISCALIEGVALFGTVVCLLLAVK
jgi:F-type H+-transporting ATPase subunit c